MKKFNIFQKVGMAFAGLLATVFVSTAVAHAIPYTGDTTVASPVPAFNVFEGPTLGAPAPEHNEAKFYQGRVANGDNDSTTPFVDPVSAACTDGQKVQMRVYVHNGASADKNNNGTGPSVAHGTKVKVDLPSTAASSFTSSATISATNAASVTDTATINCNGKTVTLKYVAGSASQFSDGTNSVTAVSDSIVTSGASIQSHNVPGDVWGCWDERVYVVFSVEVKVVETPPAPVYSCDLFDISADTKRKATVTQFSYTAKNATFKNVVIDWGRNNDKTTVTNAGEVVNKTYQYPDDNSTVTYTITATVNLTANGKDVSAQCVKKLAFNGTTPPTVTTVTTTTRPTSLPSTGAGSVAGLFAAAMAAGTVGYRWFLGRRLAE